jgi:hypothetical protein
MEKGECTCFFSPDLKDELASSSMLIFVLHEDPWEYALIGVLNYLRMRCCRYKEDGSFTM